ncbi:Mn2+ homeostasis protein [Grosmannia clavigera kw1407]|uniref:Post-GPI attachment to proteins factor 3 n=1 Tax=Grosmannia clavigera (strain kw1407 / UAMH 11150) TaxID=655863 RepID=F0X9F1_GROCL|nr:Mn2+ homeostasis protein [Grosmannia clavigera kw1407]EFX05746.1 Mn2+ homeostasis protein [Grosmannia clavigera kw1407]
MQLPVRRLALLAIVLAMLASVPGATASVGDRLPEFRECVEVCRKENCGSGKAATPIPLHLRLLLWDCAAECDQTCQRIVTAHRLAAGQSVEQFHGKWPFRRLFGVQEPASVAFSLGNLWAHVTGVRRLRQTLPASYPLLPFYLGFGLVGSVSWVFSSLFHTRDFVLTERLDYFAAGASVMYGLYYTPVRLFRLDRFDRLDGIGSSASSPNTSRRDLSRRHNRPPAPCPLVLLVWTALCVALYVAHVAYLTLVRWDYGYNMAANVACGIVQNALWSWHSWRQWRLTRRFWTVWPGLAVAWLTLAMSLELFDFPPAFGIFDAHSLWHLGTIGPTVIWYNFLAKDALDDLSGKEKAED